MTTAERGVGRFTLEAGMLIRGQIRREIEMAAWSRGLDIETEESKGLFESVYRFTVRGEAEGVRRFIEGAQKWLKQIEEEVSYS